MLATNQFRICCLPVWYQTRKNWNILVHYCTVRQINLFLSVGMKLNYLGKTACLFVAFGHIPFPNQQIQLFWVFINLGENTWKQLAGSCVSGNCYMTFVPGGGNCSHGNLLRLSPSPAFRPAIHAPVPMFSIGTTALMFLFQCWPLANRFPRIRAWCTLKCDFQCPRIKYLTNGGTT
jgi:hypothetical protein